MNQTSALLHRAREMLIGRGQASQGVSWQEKALWTANRILPNLGWPGMIAVGLFVMCIPFYFSAIRPAQAEIEGLELKAPPGSAPSLDRRVDYSAATPSEQLRIFYDFFPPEKDSPHWLTLMVEIAEGNGLTLTHGEYAAIGDNVGQLRRLKISLPVKGTYPQIRRYLATLIAEIPSMSLESVQFERRNIEDSELQAKIKLILYLRQAS